MTLSHSTNAVFALIAVAGVAFARLALAMPPSLVILGALPGAAAHSLRGCNSRVSLAAQGA